MDMLTGDQIAEADLTDWRKLGQGLHARYVVGDFGTGVRFVAAVGEAGDALGHHPRVTIGDGYVDLKLLSDDAVYRDDEGNEHVVEWVTQQDVTLARRITEIAAEHAVDADPASITTIELALDTAHAATIAPVWSALLTGSTEARGRGTIGDDVRDATGRVPILWFQDTDEHETPRQRFHVDVWVPCEVADQRIAAAVAAGGIVVDDSQAPSYTVIADQDGNKACVCTADPHDDSTLPRMSRIFTTSFASVYPHYVTKVEKKGRTKAELDHVIEWLTGFDESALSGHLAAGTTFEGFFADARLNPHASLITGVVCGVRVEHVDDPLMQKIRYLDKLVDELAKGKSMDRILRA